MIKCSFHKCRSNPLSVEKREVYAVLIPRDGHRWACKYHYDLVKNKKVRPHISLIYGPSKNKKKRRPKRAFKGHFKKRSSTNVQKEAKVS